MVKRKKQQSGHPARRQLSFTARRVVADFVKWMPGAATFTEAEAGGAQLERLFARAAVEHLDPLDPLDVDALLDVVLEERDQRTSEELFDVLHDYVHFQLDSSVDAAAWEPVHDEIDDLLGGDSDASNPLAEAISSAAGLPEPARRQTLAATRVVAGVRELLDWIGAGKALTATGAPRRADIAALSSLIGVAAEGVAKLPAATGDGDDLEAARYVQSAWDVRELSAWWEALLICEIIEVRGSKVVHGEAASTWTADGLPPLDLADMLVANVVAQLLTDVHGDDVWALRLTSARIASALWALGAGVAESSGDDEFWAGAGAHTMARIARLGLVTGIAEGDYEVPELLRGSFATGVVLAMLLARAAAGDDDEPDGFFDELDDEDPASTLVSDPDVAAQMASMGVVYKPGMAAELMKEMAPLLAFEGIDLDAPGGFDGDLDTLNAALGRAMERHNLALSTAVGPTRAKALTVLRLISEAVAEGSDSLARVVMAGIPSGPDGDTPTVAQMIGTALGVLDEWHADAGVRSAPSGVRSPAWERSTMVTTNEILVAARNGRALASTEVLIRVHGGKRVLEASLLAVAACAAALAAVEGVSVREFVGRALSAG